MEVTVNLMKYLLGNEKVDWLLNRNLNNLNSNSLHVINFHVCFVQMDNIP